MSKLNYRDWIGTIDCDNPNQNLHNFAGALSFGNDKKIAISMKNLLLKGTKLKNSPHAIGIVVYTGRNTKIMM